MSTMHPYMMIVYSNKSMKTLKKALSTQYRVLESVRLRKGEFWFQVMSEKKPHLVGLQSRSAKLSEVL